MRALVAELRVQREEDRAAREAAFHELTRRLPYTIGDAYEAEAAAHRARAKVRAQRRRGTT